MVATRTRPADYGSKTKAVIEVLNELGYTAELDTSKLPDGWRRNVEKVLAKQGIKIHETAIYTTRMREAKKFADEKVHQEQKQFRAAYHTRQEAGSQSVAQAIVQRIESTDKLVPTPDLKPVVENKPEGDGPIHITINDVYAIAKFAQSYGGMKRLGKMIQVIVDHPIGQLLKE
jgi:hypothetical protein